MDLFRYAWRYELPAIVRCDCSYTATIQTFRGPDCMPFSFQQDCLIMFSCQSRRMRTLRSLLLYMSPVSALVLNPDLLRMTPSPTKPDNLSDTLLMVHGPWHTSNVLDIPSVSTSATHLSTVLVNPQVGWSCADQSETGSYAASCEDAAHHMAFTPPGSDDSQEMQWSRRYGPGVGGVPLPQAVVSCKRPASILKK